MTLNTTYKPAVAQGNGIIKEFSYSFNPISSSYIKVYFEIDGKWVEQKTGWSATVSDNGGVVTFLNAPTTRVSIERDVPESQPTSYTTSSGFQAKVIENSFDLLTGMVQELKDASDRSVKVEVGDNQSPEELLQTVYDKLDSATEIAGDAISAANQAQTAADNATAAVNSAEQTLVQTQAYVDSAKVEINNTKNTAINTINSTVAQAKSDINTAVSNAESNISTIVSDAEGSITNIAVTEANKAIANAAQEATDMATANLNSYVDGTVKPSLQTYVDQAQEDANSAAASMEQAALSATAASNYASNASADADNAAESAGLAANSAAAAKVSETNAKASETSAAATKAEVEAIAELASFGNIGDIKYTSRIDVPNGGAWCDGALYTKAQFPDIYQMLVDGKLQSTTVSAFDSTVSSKGYCELFALDTSNERFKVPSLPDKYVIDTNATAPVKGNGMTLGLTDNLHNGGLYGYPIPGVGNHISVMSGNYGANVGTANADGAALSNGLTIGVTTDPTKSGIVADTSSTGKFVTLKAYVVLYSKVLDVPASVDKALIWAEGTDAQVQALGGTKSAKGWAEASTNVNYTNITNCITEIPQDIKLELNSGTLTLKAGSKVYVPNGFKEDGTTPKFDEITTTKDYSMSGAIGGNNTKVFIAYRNNAITSRPVSQSVSGAGATTSSGFAFDITANKINFYNASGVLQSEGWSFPIAIVSTDSSGVSSSIDQVFNGFGYIGSTVFVLPGVKGLIPNGRNADGTLKNIEFTLDKVLTFKLSTSNTYEPQMLLFDSALNIQGPTTIRTISYNEVDNYTTYNNTNKSWLPIITLIYNDNKITSFTPKTAFHALDYNDRETIVGWGMPDYSAGISLSDITPSNPYTAPADGYLYCNIYNCTAYVNTNQVAYSDIGTNSISVVIILSKDDVVTVSQNELNRCKFCPCKGV